MSKFDEFVNAVLNGARDLAVVVFNGLEDSAKDDAKAFLEKFEADLKRWTKLLAVEEITERDFADLVHAKKALAELHVLTRAGVSLTRLERFRSGLIDLVIDTAFKVFIFFGAVPAGAQARYDDENESHKSNCHKGL